VGQGTLGSVKGVPVSASLFIEFLRANGKTVKGSGIRNKRKPVGFVWERGAGRTLGFGVNATPTRRDGADSKPQRSRGQKSEVRGHAAEGCSQYPFALRRGSFLSCFELKRVYIDL